MKKKNIAISQVFSWKWDVTNLYSESEQNLKTDSVQLSVREFIESHVFMSVGKISISGRFSRNGTSVRRAALAQLCCSSMYDSPLLLNSQLTRVELEALLKNTQKMMLVSGPGDLMKSLMLTTQCRQRAIAASRTLHCLVWKPHLGPFFFVRIYINSWFCLAPKFKCFCMIKLEVLLPRMENL